LARNFALRMVMQVRDKIPNLPVVLLPDIRGALEAQALSGQGGNPDSDAIARAIGFTHGQLGLQHALLQMIWRDDLTGLHNRRGFMALATRHLACARDMGQSMVMFFADLDGLKSINDRFGHGEGDRALARAAACFKQTFRKFDLTARLSGDEFVALTVEVPGRSTAAICRRLQSLLSRCSGIEYKLSLSVGVAHFDPASPVTLQELMRQADVALYRHKRRDRRAPDGTAPVSLIPRASVIQPVTTGG
jgi:diguanylate cyclase (GGDEF)-like protein